MTTEQEFLQAIDECRNIFTKKLTDYGAAWRIMRPESVTDQIFIKANRIRSIELKGVHHNHQHREYIHKADHGKQKCQQAFCHFCLLKISQFHYAASSLLRVPASCNRPSPATRMKNRTAFA